MAGVALKCQCDLVSIMVPKSDAAVKMLLLDENLAHRRRIQVKEINSRWDIYHEECD